MNKYYNYPNIDLWKTETWKDKTPPLAKLVLYMQQTNEIVPSDYVPSYPIEGDLKEHPLYRKKTHGIDDPAVLEELHDMGLHYHCTGQGGRKPVGERCWIIIGPQKAVDEWTKLPMLLVFDKQDEFDPRWTMRSVKKYWKYVEDVAKSKDYFLVIKTDVDLDEAMIWINILQEICCLYPIDTKQVHLDVSNIVDHMKLKDVPNYRYISSTGEEKDPDANVESFAAMNVPTINIYGQWNNCDSLHRALVMTHPMNEGRFDREWLVHSEVGKNMAQDMLYEWHYDNVEDPRMKAEMEAKGLVYNIKYDARGDRYIVAFPRQQYEEGTKIPLVLVLQEVYSGNEHLAVTAHSYAAEWLEIAAQGECGVIYYALEDIESNDNAIAIIKKEAEELPIDLSRVYLTGHSHDGYFAYAMANRNPDFVTAIATLGMGLCPEGMNTPPDYSNCHEIMKHDIPTVNVTGLCESGFPEDEADKQNRWIPMWKHIMKNHNIPIKSTEEIEAAFTSSNYVQKTTCMPGDRFHLLWKDGIEFYTVDFLNNKGKNHLRVIRQQNMPHTITPMMCTLSWDFLRRFRRDPETKEIIELFEI